MSTSSFEDESSEVSESEVELDNLDEVQMEMLRDSPVDTLNHGTGNSRLESLKGLVLTPSETALTTAFAKGKMRVPPKNVWPQRYLNFARKFYFHGDAHCYTPAEMVEWCGGDMAYLKRVYKTVIDKKGEQCFARDFPRSN